VACFKPFTLHFRGGRFSLSLEGVRYAASLFYVEILKFLKPAFSECVIRLFYDIKMLYNCVKFCVMYTRGEMVNVYTNSVRRSEGKKSLVKRSCRWEDNINRRP
jgi:hypothetical protein